MDVGKAWRDGLQNHRAFGLGLESVTAPFTGGTGGLKKGSVGAHWVLSGQPELALLAEYSVGR